MSAKKNIAVVAGGYSSEYHISIKSAQTIMNHLPKDYYDPYLVVISKDAWKVEKDQTTYPIDREDFSFVVDGRKINFDCAYITIHGTPGEDGKLQGYFDMIGVPYTSCNATVSAITFNKWYNNQVLLNNGFSCAQSMILRNPNHGYAAKEIVERLGLPCYVKPNDGGSSFGISKVKEEGEILSAIEKAFEEGKEVVIEANMQGREVTCGAYAYQGKIYALPITEIVSHKEYFDYQAKYEGLSDEITPARISDELTQLVQETTVKAYQVMNLRGIIRIDFILKNDKPHIIEINTAPGMSPESIIPQQVRAYDGMDLSTVLHRVIEEVLP